MSAVPARISFVILFLWFCNSFFSENEEIYPLSDFPMFSAGCPKISAITRFDVYKSKNNIPESYCECRMLYPLDPREIDVSTAKTNAAFTVSQLESYKPHLSDSLDMWESSVKRNAGSGAKTITVVTAKYNLESTPIRKLQEAAEGTVYLTEPLK